jgi:hypothetical protein
MPHAHGGAGENPEEIRAFADHLLHNGPPLARIRETGRDGSAVWATYNSEVPILKAELNYTSDTGRWQDRKWEAIPAQQTEGRISATLPEGTRVYYFNLYDQRDCVVSTEHQE